MEEIPEESDPVQSGKDSIEVEIVSDEEFKILDEALQNAMMQIAQEGKQNHFNFLRIAPKSRIVNGLFLFYTCSGFVLSNGPVSLLRPRYF